MIKLDVTTLSRRYEQIKNYTYGAKATCASGNVQYQEICTDLETITKRDLEYAGKLIRQISTIYKAPSNIRRGLINGIGSVAKSLFGTMDADDEKRINEQLQIMGNKQQTLNHVMQNQIKIINATIGHIDKVETIIERNRKLLEKRVSEYINREEIRELFTINNAVIAELIRDAGNIIEYLTYVRQGTMHPKLMPVDDIMEHLKDATQQLPQGSYFPFRVNKEEWLTIEELATIRAYYFKEQIYTILYIPLIAPPIYDVINVMELPVLTADNVFTSTRVEHKIIAVDKEKSSYILTTEKDLQQCIWVNLQYICKHNVPIYRMEPNAPCEVQMYVQQHQYHHDCKLRHTAITHTKWIALQQPYAWLYATAGEQPVNIQCGERFEDRITIQNTGKITLGKNCKLITADTTIQTRETIYETDIETYLPAVSMLLPNYTVTPHQDATEDETQQRAELIDLRAQLHRMTNELKDNDEQFFVQKQFIYPMATSAITIALVIGVLIYIIIRTTRKHRARARPTVRLCDESYGFPKSILKRSQSTRF